MEFLRFPPLNLLEKIRLGATIFYASKIRNWRKLEQIPVTQWLQKWSGQGTFEKIWLPLLQAKLGENYRIASAAFIWATIQRMYKARQTGLKKELFGYVPGGYARILSRLSEHLQQLGCEIRLGEATQSVQSAADVASVATDRGQHEFDRVVMTTPAHVTANICPGLTLEERERFEGVDYQGIVCTSVLLKKSLSPYYVTNITDSWVPLTGVIEMTQIVDPATFGGRHLVYLPRYVPSNDPWLDKPTEEIESTFRDTLLKMYPHLENGDIEVMKTSKVRHVMAVPRLNYSQQVPPQTLSLPNVYAVNSAQIYKGILNVNETIEIAEEAMEQVLMPQDAAKIATP